MKSTKRIIFIVLMILCIGLPCENYQSYLDTVKNFTQTTFYCPEDTDFDTMLDDIEATADKHDIMVFKIRSQVHNMFFSEIDIYGEKPVLDYLADEYDIYSGKFNSIFSGTTTVNLHPFNDITRELAGAEPDFQLIGDIDDMRDFKAELINTYAGNFPKENNYNFRKDPISLTVAIWILAIILTGFFTLYETFMLKKETFIRITMGESPAGRWLRYILEDILYLCAVFGICSLAVFGFYKVLFLYKYVLLMFAILIALDVVISLNLLIYSRNTALSNTPVSESILVVNNIIRCFVIVISAVCMSAALSFIYEGYRFYKQKPFYERYSDYVVVSHLKYEEDLDAFTVPGEFYKNYNESLDITFLCQWLSLPVSDKTAVKANHNSVEYIRSAIPELKDCEFDKDVYIIHRDSEKLQPQDISSLYPNVECEVAELEYHDRSEIVAFATDEITENLTTWCEDPIIVLYNKDFAELIDEPELLAGAVPLSLCFVRNSDDIRKFMSDNGVEYSATDSMDIFENEWIKLKRTSYISAVLFLLLFSLQILIIVNIIKLEYRAKAIELSIKKVMGYSVFERFRSHYIMSLVLYAVSAAAALVAVNLLNFGATRFIVFGIVFSYLTENIIFTILVNVYDRKNVQQTLKGG